MFVPSFCTILPSGTPIFAHLLTFGFALRSKCPESLQCSWQVSILPFETCFNCDHLPYLWSPILSVSPEIFPEFLGPWRMLLGGSFFRANRSQDRRSGHARQLPTGYISLPEPHFHLKLYNCSRTGASIKLGQIAQDASIYSRRSSYPLNSSNPPHDTVIWRRLIADRPPSTNASLHFQ